MAGSAHSDDILCEARGVSHEYLQPNGKPFTALRDIALAIRRREVVALLGPSGCGKSTLLRILAGLARPTRGEVFYRGAAFAGINPGMALVFQSFALYPWMTVAGNIRAVLEAAGKPPAEIAERVAQAIARVGLTGFEGSYPRELSGGMKQRVGVARAIALDPEILFLDEPFCHVDALTAESLRSEILDLWAAPGGNPSSILLVSHDIAEVVGMADRIVLLGANPGQVRQIVDNPLPRPRDLRSPPALALIDHLHDLITGHELPDVVPTAAVPPAPEVLPPVRAIQVLGLLELLGGRGGSDDLFQLADDTGQEFGLLIRVAKAAEMLGFITTPKRQVVLSADGRAMVHADSVHRAVLWRDALLRLRLVRSVVETVRRHGAAGADRDDILESLILALPEADYEELFTTLINWARVGDLLAFDEATGRVTLPLSPQPVAAVARAELAPYLDPGRVLFLPGTPARDAVLASLCEALGRSPAVADGAAFAAAVQAREATTSTAVGHRVALPHAQVASVSDFAIAVAVVPGGCDFTAADGQSVQIVVMIAAPANDRPRYLRILAETAGRLNRAEVRERIAAATEAATVVAALAGASRPA